MCSNNISYLWDKPSIFVVSGKSSERYLHGRCSQDIKTLKSRELRWSLILNPQGKIEGKFLIGRENDDFYIFSDSLEDEEQKEDFVKALLRYKVADQIDVTHLSQNISRLSLFNKSSEAESLFDFLNKNIQNNAKIIKFKLSIPDYTEDLFLFLDCKCSNEELREVISQKIKVASFDEYNKYRIEHSILQMHKDIDSSIIAPDLPLDNFLTIGKGCYAGQEVVEMATARGRPNRKVVKILSNSRISNIKRNPIFAGDSEVGFITSGVNFDSISGSGFLALGFIKNKPIDGLEIFIKDGDRMVAASIKNV